MKTFKDYVIETMKPLEEINDNDVLVVLDINNTNKLFQAAMRTKNSEGLKKTMLNMKAQFKDGKKIDFSEVDWDNVYSRLNEKEKEND